MKRRTRPLYFRVETVDWPHGLIKSEAVAVDPSANMSKALARYESALYYVSLEDAEAAAAALNAQFKKEGRLYD